MDILCAKKTCFIAWFLNPGICKHTILLSQYFKHCDKDVYNFIHEFPIMFLIDIIVHATNNITYIIITILVAAPNLVIYDNAL